MTRQNLNGKLHQIVDELVSQGVTLEQARQEFERQFITASLRSNDWNFCRSARSLGVHRNTLRNKVSHLGIAGNDGRGRGTGTRTALRRLLPKV
ncbi:MAG: helix-turn-helix domain-containing protein [Thermoanaerobaculia bacterium]